MSENGTMHDSLLKAGEGILVRVTSCNVKSQTKEVSLQKIWEYEFIAFRVTFAYSPRIYK